MNNEQLAKRFCRRIKEVSQQKVPQISARWVEKRADFIHCALNNDVSNFLKWDVVSISMTYKPGVADLYFLMGLPDWERWNKAIIKSNVGNPCVCDIYLKSCYNMIHQALHLAHFLQSTQSKIEDIKTVFDFGSGFGCMCRLMYLRGFSGQYIIADLPEINALQEYYLASTLPEKEISFGGYSVNADVVLLSDMPTFQRVIAEKGKKGLFIANWSLSESPFLLRDEILQHVFESVDFVEISYQIEWEGYNNKRYFTEVVAKAVDFNWNVFRVPHLNEEQFYMCGKRI